MKNEHENVKGVAYVRGRCFVRCLDCGLYLPLVNRNSAHCPSCKCWFVIKDGVVRKDGGKL